MIRTWFSSRRPRTPRAWTAAASGLVIVTMLLAASTGPFLYASPSASPSVAASPSSSPEQPGEWAALELAPDAPIAQLTPDTPDGSRVDVGGSFTLRSLTSAPAVELAQGLRVEPAVELVVEAGASADVASVRPREPLVPNARYRFRLAAPDGSLAEEWSFRTGGPLHVVSMLPSDHTTQVPLDTGIEIEFDQDDAIDVASHVSIEPSLPGRFEQHGRTWVFVPSTNLAPATLYTVTVSPGIRIDGTDHVLETEWRSAFETAAAEGELEEPTILFDHPVFEVLPDEAPVLAVVVHGSVEQGQTLGREVAVYRLPTLQDAMDAATMLSVDRRWASWSSSGNVDTSGLEPVAAFEVAVTSDERASRMALPTGFPAGWYLLEVTQPGRDAQLLLQVTDLGVYALVSRTSTVAWVNDLTRDAPMQGAQVTLDDGSGLGRTDADGLLEMATPDELDALHASAEPRLMVVTAGDGRRVIAPLNPDGAWYDSNDPRSDWWLLLDTDRLAYRQDDTVHAWGLIRSRRDRSVPARAELRLVAGLDAQGPPLARASVMPTARGVITGDLPIRDLPPGQYAVALFVDGEAISSSGISVTDIRKPTFRVTVETDRRVYLHGDRVDVEAATTFYDGTAAPGIDLRLYASGVTEDERVVTAGPTGRATTSYQAVASNGYPDSGYLSATPSAPEQGSSQGSTSFMVFPSSVWLTADAKVGGGGLQVEGRLSRVDLAAAEAQFEASRWVEDPAGTGVSGTVTIVVKRVTWNPVRTGTTYDFLLKRQVPQYRYDQVVEPIGTFRPTADGDGAFAVTVPVQDVATGSFEITLSAADAAGRVVRQSAYVERPGGMPAAVSYPYLEERLSCGWAVTRAADVDQAVELTVYDGDGSPSDGRTLFVVGRLGIDQVVVTSAATLERMFADQDLPGMTVRAIRFSSAGYVVTNDVIVHLEDGARQVDIELEADRERYAPGDPAAVTIRTTGPDGRPIAADVLVQALDMKLFAIGAADEIDTRSLMAGVSAGFLGSYASHRIPSAWSSEGCGAATGGGDDDGGLRDDFADVATFQRVATDADGRGSVTFDLPDDLTSWGVSATAFADGLESGTQTIEVPVGLPFFVDAAVASEYLAGEEATIRLVAYGDALSEGDAVRFTLSAPSLGLEATVDGRAFEASVATLPTLTLGDHRLAIRAERIGSGQAARDGIVRTVRVVPTRLRTLQASYAPLTDGFVPAGGDGLTTYVMTDAGRGGLLRALQELAAGSSARFDTILAADLARELLIEEFAADEASLPGSGLDGLPLPSANGIALLPYAAPDLLLTAKGALVGRDRLQPDALRYALRDWADESGASRERQIIALAGLASLGEEVGARLAAFDPDDLTVREQVWLALGLLATGDEPAARAIERAVLTAHGQRLGPWVRLDVGAETPETAETTASMLLLAARLRDPVAVDISRYLLDNPSTQGVSVLEQVGYVQAALEWLPRPAARFAWSVDGERHEETIEPGGSFSLTLSAAQRRSLELERLEGDLVVATTWAGEADYDALPDDPLVSIERVVTPAADAPADRLVRVHLNVTFEQGAPRGCYQVTDLLPSGLAPLVATAYAFAPEDEPAVIAPYEVEGQRVSWCVDPAWSVGQLGYWARVVSSGTYRWEPAVIQSVAAPAVGSATAPVDYRIR